MIIFVENPNTFGDIVLKLIIEFSIVPGYES